MLQRLESFLAWYAPIITRAPAILALLIWATIFYVAGRYGYHLHLPTWSWRHA